MKIYRKIIGVLLLFVGTFLVASIFEAIDKPLSTILAMVVVAMFILSIGGLLLIWDTEAPYQD